MAPIRLYSEQDTFSVAEFSLPNPVGIALVSAWASLCIIVLIFYCACGKKQADEPKNDLKGPTSQEEKDEKPVCGSSEMQKADELKTAKDEKPKTVIPEPCVVKSVVAKTAIAPPTTTEKSAPPKAPSVAVAKASVLTKTEVKTVVKPKPKLPDPPKTWVVAKTVIAPPTKRTKETLVKAPEKTTPKSPATEKEALKTSKEEPPPAAATSIVGNQLMLSTKPAEGGGTSVRPGAPSIVGNLMLSTKPAEGGNVSLVRSGSVVGGPEALEKMAAKKMASSSFRPPSMSVLPGTGGKLGPPENKSRRV